MCVIYITSVNLDNTISSHDERDARTINCTLLDTLGTLAPDKKKDWKRYVNPLVHAYNSTRHESTGYTPFLLMLGREPRLPIDLAFGINFQNRKHPFSKYVDSLKEKLKYSYKISPRRH